MEESSLPKLIGFASIVLFLFLWPLLTTVFLLSNYDRLKEQKFEERYSKLYFGIKVNSTGALAYQGVFAVRRWFIIFTSLMLTANSPLLGTSREHYLEKVMCFLAVQSAYILYI